MLASKLNAVLPYRQGREGGSTRKTPNEGCNDCCRHGDAGDRGGVVAGLSVIGRGKRYGQTTKS
jgi:hypothetical protein